MKPTRKSNPTLIAAKTTIGFGAPARPAPTRCTARRSAPTEIAATRKALSGWSYKCVRGSGRRAGRLARRRRRGMNTCCMGRAPYSTRSMPASASPEFERRMAGTLPAGLDKAIADYKKLAEDKPKVATANRRKWRWRSSTACCRKPSRQLGRLTGSNNTKTSRPGRSRRRQLRRALHHYGIRRLSVAAAMNNWPCMAASFPMAAPSCAPICAPGLRLASLMGIRSVYVMTHGSIGLSEDGPTTSRLSIWPPCAPSQHNVFRPADATGVGRGAGRSAGNGKARRRWR